MPHVDYFGNAFGYKVNAVLGRLDVPDTGQDF
jgi:hypothetical protein